MTDDEKILFAELRKLSFSPTSFDGRWIRHLKEEDKLSEVSRIMLVSRFHKNKDRIPDYGRIKNELGIFKKTETMSDQRRLKRIRIRQLEKDFEELNNKMQAHFFGNGYDKLDQETLKKLDAGTHEDDSLQKEYEKGKQMYVKLMAMKLKYEELKGNVVVGSNENGELTVTQAPDERMNITELINQLKEQLK